MGLNWSKADFIAKALAEAYPHIDRMSLDKEELLDMITALPDFNDSPLPPKNAYLDHILWTWMRLADSCFDKAV